ncbi:MAG: TetR/AcrR family transcriptional regulator [Thermodesulfovibrionales bacterium]|nr:TetR/AcrR family transcriptional regulator [Thermodesulfovibrionales bacterium]
MNGQSTKDRILQAALELFSKKGYLGATTREIAARAEVAELTLFRYFSTKERLFEEVINTYSLLPRFKELLVEIKDKPYRDALITIAVRFLELLNERKDLISIMHSEMQRYPDKIKKIHDSLIHEILRLLSDYFDYLQKKAIVRKINSEYAARAFLGMFFSYFYAKEIKMFTRYKGDDSKRIVDAYVDIFINGTLMHEG